MVEVTEKELKLLERLRKIAYGQVIIYQENKQPVRIEMIRESEEL